MMPLAQIVAAAGHRVAGSDRALDQGRTAPKFEAMRGQGIALFAQDGSGLVSADQIVVASAAIEATVPDIVRAAELGCPRLSRAELLAELFNAASVNLAVGGTSGKSTVTGMIGWILTEAGRDPTIMNGAIMKNFDSGARVGTGGMFVSEVDESDGSIALYRPGIAVLNNVAVDHKSMEELRILFGDFLTRAGACVINADNAEAIAIAPGNAVTFGLRTKATLTAGDIVERPDGVDFTVTDHRSDETSAASLGVPGRHNVSNAMAAIGAATLAGVSMADAIAALSTFTGLRRRMELVGTASNVTVIDDFGHNPDKIAATLTALHAFPGRLLLFFQPHGYGPLKLMSRELADSFIANMKPDDHLIISDPAYFGGTVDRSIGSDTLVAMVGAQAEHIAQRPEITARLMALARPGDRIVVMGARDDTLSTFAAGLLDTLSAS